jgi:8-amino-7-oxononanoate synthase
MCVQDKLNHASLLDATRPAVHARAAIRTWTPKGDAPAQARLTARRCWPPTVLQHGWRHRTAAHCRWWQRLQQALFYVDDAHGVGVVGDGRGAVAAAGLGVDDVPLQLVTLGKALGGSGALVLGRDDLVEHWPKLHARTSTPPRCRRRGRSSTGSGAPGAGTTGGAPN